MDNNEQVAEAIIEVLQYALQGDNESQRLADERRKAFECVSDYPYILLDIVHGCYEHCDFTTRHMASVFLKNYVASLAQDENTVETVGWPQLQHLSHVLVDEVYHENKNICIMLTETLVILAVMGCWRFFEKRIYAMLRNEDDQTALITAVQFFSQLLTSGRAAYLPIDMDDETFVHLMALYQRAAPIDMKLNLTDILCDFIVRPFSENVSSREALLKQLLPLFGKTIYDGSLEGGRYSFSLQGRLLNRLAYGVAHSHCEASHSFMTLMPFVGQLLLKCCNDYKLFVQNTSAMSDDDRGELFVLIEVILKFVTELILAPLYIDIVLGDLHSIFYCVTIFTCCITQEEYDHSLEENCDDNEGSYEMDDSNLISSRARALSTFIDILTHIGSENLATYFASLHFAHEKLLQEYNGAATANAANQTASTLYYRIVEAIMTILYEIKKHFPKERIFSDEQLFNQNNYFNIFTFLFINDENRVLLGRLFLFVSIYSASVCSDTLALHVREILGRLSTTNDIGTNWFLATALRNHLTCMPYSPDVNRHVFSLHANEIATCLLKYVDLIYAKPQIYLPALGNLINCSESMALHFATNLEQIITHCIRLHYCNLHTMEQVNFVLSCIARHSATTCATLNAGVIPFLVELITRTPTEVKEEESIIPERALDALNTIAIHAVTPLNDCVVQQIFFKVYEKIMAKQDPLIHSGSTFISLYLLKFLAQFSAITDEKGASLSSYLPRVLSELLTNSKKNMSKDISRTCVLLIITLHEHNMLDTQSVLKCILTTLQVYEATDSMFMEEMVTIFLSVFMCYPHQTINFLSAVPGPTGGSAFSFLLKCWSPSLFLSQGLFERTFNPMAVVKILQNVLDSPSTRLSQVDALSHYYDKDGSAMEYLYLLLLLTLAREIRNDKPTVRGTKKMCRKETEADDEEDDYFYSAKTYHRFEEEKQLFSYHRWSTINIVDEIRNLLLQEVSLYFVNIVINKLLLSQDDLYALQSIGIPFTMPNFDVPVVPMACSTFDGSPDAPME